MNIIFAGTPEFAAQSLDAIIQAGHHVAMVLTQPDRPAGRGMSLHASPVKQLAERHGLPVYQPLTLKTGEAQARLQDVGADIMVVAAYGLILPKAVLDLPVHGCINIHASLLPRWRGAAPIQRAILAGDQETGITIMQMDEGLDTGAMLSQHGLAIEGGDTAQTLHDRLALLGAEAACLALDKLSRGPWAGQIQDDERSCYAPKLSKAEARLDWTRPAIELERAVRAYNPFPVAQASYKGETWRIWRAVFSSEGAGLPGQIQKADHDGLRVSCGACGEGSLIIKELQKSGGRRLPVDQFLRGNPVQEGDCFDA
ncbi:MAG: methionyl-tRNA formyltransferase [Sulfuricellaceae bacterium]|nr:methionyl-tRNA formyltransferase [Sulfuricellaceae bacterium]